MEVGRDIPHINIGISIFKLSKKELLLLLKNHYKICNNYLNIYLI